MSDYMMVKVWAVFSNSFRQFGVIGDPKIVRYWSAGVMLCFKFPVGRHAYYDPVVYVRYVLS